MPFSFWIYFLIWERLGWWVIKVSRYSRAFRLASTFKVTTESTRFLSRCRKRCCENDLKKSEQQKLWSPLGQCERNQIAIASHLQEAWQIEAEKSTPEPSHHRRVRKVYIFHARFDGRGGAQSLRPVLDHRSTLEARRFAHRERAKTSRRKEEGPHCLPGQTGKEIAAVFLR